MKPSRIFVDLDDVLNKFTMSALKELGCPVDEDDYHLYKLSWGFNILHAANELRDHPRKFRDKDEIWCRLGEDWWSRRLPPSEFAVALLNACRRLVGHSHVFIMTSPTCLPETATWKIKWIQKHLPRWIRSQYIINERKYLCANRDSLLIDDNETNTVEFNCCSGQTILVPRPWNTLCGLTNSWLAHVLKRLEEL